MSSFSDSLPLPNDAAADDPLRPVSIEEESRAFWRLRARLTLSVIRQTLRQARLRLVLIVLLTLFFWFGLGYLFYQGFQLLEPIFGGDQTDYAQTMRAIYNVFFVSLMVMLVFSAAIIQYSSLYRSPEPQLLLTLPARPERIVLFKHQEAMFFSSWGFLLLTSPMLVAYGITQGSPWYYYTMLPLFLLAFVCIPCALGSMLCLVVIDRIPKLRVNWLASILLGFVALMLWLGWSVLSQAEGQLLTPSWFNKLLARLQFSEYRLLPSWWLSSGLLEAARKDVGTLEYQPWAESLKFLALLTANAMFSYLLCAWAASRFYRRGFSEHWGDSPPRRMSPNLLLDRVASGLLCWLPRSWQLLIIKDSRLFRRDPVQWSQFLIFFGLLTIYFVNIRSFSYEGNLEAYINMISFLNLAVVGLILSTFTTRFIFPLISLEGKRIWVLSLLPVTRGTILWNKFLFAVLGSWIPCALLIFMSDMMLQVAWPVFAIHQYACLLLCSGLAGIAVGLGARFPDFQEVSPSKIAAGFGGTLCLVLSAMYIIVIVLVTALPTHLEHLRSTGESSRIAAYLIERVWFYNNSLWLGWIVAGLIGLFATFQPLRLGLRAFREMESY
jgi:ABC-2 type transport system permease protein